MPIKLFSGKRELQLSGNGFSLNFFRHTSVLICKRDCTINCGITHTWLKLLVVYKRKSHWSSLEVWGTDQVANGQLNLKGCLGGITSHHRRPRSRLWAIVLLKLVHLCWISGILLETVIIILKLDFAMFYGQLELKWCSGRNYITPRTNLLQIISHYP